MKNYFLLRDNHESGPFSLQEISSMDLYASDLVWIDRESTAWLHPGEIAELKDRIVARPKSSPIKHSRPVSNEENPVEARAHICQSPTVLRERLDEFRKKAPIWSRSNSVMGDVISVAAIFGGVVLGAFLMKKMVDDFSVIPVETAHAPAQILIQPDPVPQVYKNALLSEVVVARDTPKKVVKKPAFRDIKKQLIIRGSDYKVGLLGGINNLELKVHNNSPHTADKVSVAVQYLKKDGSVIHTDHYELYSIRPHSLKTLKVPDSRRGVKVKYEILSVQSNDFSKKMKQV